MLFKKQKTTEEEVYAYCAAMYNHGTFPTEILVARVFGISQDVAKKQLLIIRERFNQIHRPVCRPDKVIHI